MSNNDNSRQIFNKAGKLVATFRPYAPGEKEAMMALMGPSAMVREMIRESDGDAAADDFQQARDMDEMGSNIYDDDLS
jgi:hypothetical protein